MADLPNTRIRRYLIEVKDPQGKSVFLTAAYWDEHDKRIAIAQIMRLADIPEVNSWSEPPLEPEIWQDHSPFYSRSRAPRPAPVMLT